MCGACGRAVVSPTTARLNARGAKPLVLARLRAGLAPGCRLQLVGDGWTLVRRSGSGEHHADVEGLIAALEQGASADWRGGTTPRAVLAEVLATSSA